MRVLSGDHKQRNSLRLSPAKAGLAGLSDRALQVAAAVPMSKMFYILIIV